jgi:hypothetical protein
MKARPQKGHGLAPHDKPTTTRCYIEAHKGDYKNVLGIATARDRRTLERGTTNEKVRVRKFKATTKRQEAELLQRLGIERLEALQKTQQHHWFLWTSPGYLRRPPFHENGVR